MRKRLTIFSLTIPAILLFHKTQAQTDQIMIGQSAIKVHSLVVGEAEQYNRKNGAKDQSRMTYDLKYSNGDIIEVILCNKNENDSAIDLSASHCEHYMMTDGKLSFIQKEYERMTVAHLTAIYDKMSYYHKVGPLYFTNDYKYYTRIYAASNGQATAEYRKTITSELTADVLKLLQKQLPAIKAAEKEEYHESTESGEPAMTGSLLSSRVEIGQSAAEVQSFIEYTTREYNKISRTRNKASSFCSADVQYQNGKIAAVIQCYTKAYLADFQQIADYCKQYRMVDDRLSVIITQYGNISVGKLMANYDRTSSDNKLGGLYFTEDYEHYTKIYLAENGLATTAYYKTIVSALPSDIRNTVDANLTAIRTDIRKNETAAYVKAFTEEETSRKLREKTLYSCEPFQEGLAAVSIASGKKAFNEELGNYLYGYINEKGNYAIQPQFNKVTSFHEGFAVVSRKMSGSIYEYINQAGENIFNKVFFSAQPFSEGLAAVENRDGLTFIDKTGKSITSRLYEEVGNFKEGFARVRFNGKWGFIDKTGNEVIPPQYKWVKDFSDGIAFVRNNNDEVIYIDKTGKTVILPNVPTVYTFVNNFIIVKEGGKFGFKKRNNKWLAKPIYEEAGNFSEGLARVKVNGSWGFIDTIGKMVISKDILKKNETKEDSYFEEVSDFSEGFAMVKVKGLYGYIDREGKWLIPPSLEIAKPFSNGKAIVLMPGRKGCNFIDKTGNILFTDFL